MIQTDDIFKKIGFILNDLQDQQEYLAHHPEKVNIPEIELFMANADFLSDHVKVYFKLKSQELADAQIMNQKQDESPTTAVEISGEPVDAMFESDAENEVAENEEIESRVDLQPAEDILPVDDDSDRFSFDFELKEDANTEKFEFEEKPVEELYNRTLTEEEKMVIAAKKNRELLPEEKEDEQGPEPFLIPAAAEEAALEESPITLPAESPRIRVSDQPAKKPTINELLASGNAGNANTSNRKAAISDLKQAINLNDKLLFIKDLFNGYNLAYAEAIEIINKLPDFAAADSFLQKNYALKNEWASKQSTTDRFYELLNQRFPAEDK